MINIIIIALIIVLIGLDVFYLIYTQHKAKKAGVKASCLACDSYKENKCDHKCVATTMNFINKKTQKDTGSTSK